MKKLELKEETLEIAFKGESHQMRLPSNSEILELRKDGESLNEEGDSMEVMYAFLEKLGLPRVFSSKLTPRHTVQIMESISDVKS